MLPRSKPEMKVNLSRIFFSTWPNHGIHYQKAPYVVVSEEQIIHEQLQHRLSHWVCITAVHWSVQNIDLHNCCIYMVYIQKLYIYILYRWNAYNLVTE